MVNILLFDIEVTPNQMLSWECKIRSGYLGPENIIKERVMSCAAWKWLGCKKVKHAIWDRKTQNDKPICKALLKAWRKADAVITQNGDEFDIKWLRGRSAVHKLEPMHEIIQIDTKKMAKKAFNLNSYAMDYMGKLFELGEKIPTNFGLWKRVLNGQKKCPPRASPLL